MQRPPFPSLAQQPGSGGSINPAYFETSMPTPSQQQMFHPSQGLGFSGTSSGGGSLSSSLTFTPSGITVAAPSFKNIKTTIKSLTENFENVLSASFNADATFLQNYTTTIEKALMNAQNPGSLMEIDEKPFVEPDQNSDAEVFALIQEMMAVNGFGQIAAQAVLTAKYLPQTAVSHLDAALELPHNLDNPTLNEIQQMANTQISVSKRYRKFFADTITAIAAAVQPPVEEEMNKFLDEFRL